MESASWRFCRLPGQLVVCGAALGHGSWWRGCAALGTGSLISVLAFFWAMGGAPVSGGWGEEAPNTLFCWRHLTVPNKGSSLTCSSTSGLVCLGVCWKWGPHQVRSAPCPQQQRHSTGKAFVDLDQGCLEVKIRPHPCLTYSPGPDPVVCTVSSEPRACSSQQPEDLSPPPVPLMKGQTWLPLHWTWNPGSDVCSLWTWVPFNSKAHVSSNYPTGPAPTAYAFLPALC